MAGEAVDGALAAAGLPSAAIQAAWVGGAASHAFGPPTLVGAAWLAGTLPGVPVVQVEAACATGGYALHGAWLAVASGQVDVALALGVDRADVPDPVALLDAAVLPGTLDHVGIARSERPVLLDVAAASLRGADVGRLAEVVVEARAAGAANPKAWLRKPTTVEAVLAEPVVADPLRRSMCCALVDGAAAVVVTRAPRAVRIGAVALGAGRFRGVGAPSSVAGVAARARAVAGVEAREIELAEVHDHNAWAWLRAVEDLGLRSDAKVNPSGGLLSRGHALAATGLAQVVEVAGRLRAGGVGVCHNIGGQLGDEPAAIAISVLMGEPPRPRGG